MATRTRAVDVGASRGRTSLARLTADIRAARTASGLAQTDVARALGLSRSQYGRIERGQSPSLSLLTAARLCAILGLDLSVRAFPAGDPIRDAAQIALLERLRSRCHASLRWHTEVPFHIQRDRRAWDATISNGSWSAGIEAETAVTDIQALDRRLALKERDGGMDRVILVLLDSRRNRTALRSSGGFLNLRFPVDARAALFALAAGTDPGGNALVLL